MVEDSTLNCSRCTHRICRLLYIHSLQQNSRHSSTAPRGLVRISRTIEELNVSIVYIIMEDLHVVHPLPQAIESI